MVAVKCRICGSAARRFLSLGETPLANSFLRKEQLDSNEPQFPLNVCLCEACGLVQLDCLVPPEVMYRNYIYFSSTSELMQEHFSQLADEVASRLPRSAFVVEIASNDGIVLRSLKRHGCDVLGIEPATNIAEHANKSGISTLNEFWSSALAERLVKERGQADAVLANNVMGHVHDLNDFAQGISILLKDTGMAVIQVQYLVDFIEKLEYDTVYHEHVSYISLHPVVQLFRRHGLEVFDVQRFPGIHGGSVRFSIGKGARTRAVDELLEYERKEGFLSRQKYEAFARRVEGHRAAFLQLLNSVKSEGKRIAGYGAAAKANTLLNYCGVGPSVIEYISDKSPHKQGLYTPGMHIPVVPPEKIDADMPDYVVILAWNFADEVMRQQKAYAARGGRFIVPVPWPLIV